MLKRLTTVLVLMLAFTTLSVAQKWEFDKPHSNIGFSVRHLVITKTIGQFDDYLGYVIFDGKNVETGTVEITIHVNSINTDNQKRDDHLRSGDFFDVEKYPTMKFKSRKIIKDAGNNFKIVGDLTIKDVTKEVILDAEFNGVLTGPMGNIRAGFTAGTKINRHDFNVAWNNKLQDGTLIVGEEVDISLEIELIKEK